MRTALLRIRRGLEPSSPFRFASYCVALLGLVACIVAQVAYDRGGNRFSFGLLLWTIFPFVVTALFAHLVRAFRFASKLTVCISLLLALSCWRYIAITDEDDMGSFIFLATPLVQLIAFSLFACCAWPYPIRRSGLRRSAVKP